MSPEDRVVRFFEQEDEATLSPRRRASWAVGDLGREIIDRLVDTKAPTSDLEAIAVELERVATRLRRFEHGRDYEGYSEASTASAERPATGGGPPAGHADFSPLIGRSNPIAPPMQIFAVEGDGREAVGVAAEVTFGHAYEGPPGHVHGGMVAAAFDELLGAAQAMSGAPGMTGRLTVTYRAPTPLHTPIRFESELTSVEGRKINVSGRAYAGETLCAESEGLFITVDFAKIAQMRTDRDGES